MLFISLALMFGCNGATGGKVSKSGWAKNENLVVSSRLTEYKENAQLYTNHKYGESETSYIPIVEKRFCSQSFTLNRTKYDGTKIRKVQFKIKASEEISIKMRITYNGNKDKEYLATSEFLASGEVQTITIDIEKDIQILKTMKDYEAILFLTIIQQGAEGSAEFKKFSQIKYTITDFRAYTEGI